MIRAVIDTNVLVAALINPGGIPGTLLSSIQAGLFAAIASSELIEEVLGILSFPKFQTKHRIGRADIESIVALLVFKAETVTASERLYLCRDPKDDFILETAIAGKADYIVSGDSDLLDLKKVRKIQIIKPAAFLSLLDKTRR